MISPSQWRVQPWKNGRGVTSEVLRIPDAEEYEARISVAEVTASGPFSTFPGYRRWTLLVEGGPIWLAGASTAALVELDGATPIDARVDAPGRLLNVIARPHVQVGVGATSDAWIAFALADTPELPRWYARIYDVPSRVIGDVLWVKR